MAERRRRFRNKKTSDDMRQPSMSIQAVSIAKREDTRPSTIMQPKILKKEPESAANRKPQEYPNPIKTIIVNRSDARISSERDSARSSAFTPAVALRSSPSHLSSSIAITSNKDKTDSSGGVTANAHGVQNFDAVPSMTRPASVIVANGVFNPNVRKMFQKTNTEFTVVGVLGAQGVGKSTLLNLLAAERANDYDFYQHIFAANADDCIFSTRHKTKSQKHALMQPRTETTQFFITKDRLILLDTPPLFESINARDADYLDTDSVATMAQLFSVCHIILIALSEISLEQLRMVHAALRLRAQPIGGKCFVKSYLPHVIFVRTRVKRIDFEPALHERMNKRLAQLYNSTGLHIYRGPIDQRCVNSFLIPEVSSGSATTYHKSLNEISRSFREHVLATSRTHMCHSNDFSEINWFDLLAEVTRKNTKNIERVYADRKLRYFDARTKWRTNC